VIAFSNTVRYEYSDIYGVWCLDYTRFLNGSDFELEYELHEGNKKAAVLLPCSSIKNQIYPLLGISWVIKKELDDFKFSISLC
ncbi:hypothetical protein PT115_09165, partial [Erysipelothrix rhusiopathiae]|nr:hypothetical protein [Erysipelothrix rhusiopathiae]